MSVPHPVSSFENDYSDHLPIFKPGYSSFVMLSYMSSLYILAISPLEDIICKHFSPFSGLPFCLFMVSFELPSWLRSYRICLRCRRCWFSLWVEIKLGVGSRVGHAIPLQNSGLKIPWTKESGGLQSVGSQESDTTEQLTLFHFSLSLSVQIF